MSYLALYRKFRPQKWEDVKGQEHIVTTLRNQLVSNKIGHAYLFCGTRGTGKTTIAKLFARAANCENCTDGEPCGECAACKSALIGNSVNVIEIDAASNNSVDDARTLIEEVEYPPIGAPHKVYIIDEVHMLTTQAFNALLKTIEEPPEYVIFILATTEAQKVPATIMSRCQRFDFHRISPSVISSRLKEVADAEGIKAEKKALDYIARAADGALRDGLSLLDQCASHYGDEKLTLDKVLDMLGTVDTEVFAKFFDLLIRGDVGGSLLLLDEVLLSGKEVMQFTDDFIWYMRNIMLTKTAGGESRIIDVSEDNLKILKAHAEQIDEAALMRMIRIFSEAHATLRNETQKRTLLEMTIVRVCRPSSDTDLKSLDVRLRALEEKELRVLNALKLIESGNFSMPQGPRHGDSKNNDAGTADKVGKKPALPKALPDEIKEIVKNWDDYVSDMPAHVKGFMQASPKPALSADESGDFVIVLFSKLHAEYLANDFPKDDLAAYLSEKTGKEISIRVEYMPDKESFEEKLPDLSKFINMEIEETDE